MVARLFPTSIDLFNLSRRDVSCLTAAAILHSLLLLWTGIPFEVLNEQKEKLGEVLVQVTFRSDIDSGFGQGAAPAPKRKRGFLSKMKRFFKAPAKPKKSSELAGNQQQDKIDVSRNLFKKADNKLTNKEFANTNFAGAKQQKDIDVTKGSSFAANVDKVQIKEKATSSSLKSKNYRVTQKDTPFKIMKPKKNDQLAMTNTVPVNVGRRTSSTIDSFKDVSKSPNLKPKAGTIGGGFSGVGSGGKGAQGKDGGLLATGGTTKIASANPVLGGSGGSGGYPGNSFGNRTTGTRGGGRTASGYAEGTSKDQLAGGGASGTGGVGSGLKGKNWSIKGLDNRKPLKKSFAKATFDARVVLRFRVDWIGQVLDGIVVLISSGSPSFDQKVVASLKKWVFSRLPANQSNVIQEGIITMVFKGV